MVETPKTIFFIGFFCIFLRGRGTEGLEELEELEEFRTCSLVVM